MTPKDEDGNKTLDMAEGIGPSDRLRSAERADPAFDEPTISLGRPRPAVDIGRPPKTGQLFPRGARGFPDKPQRIDLPPVGRPPRRESDSGLRGLPRGDEPARTVETVIAPGGPLARQAVATALSRLDEHLGADWTDLLARDALPALLVRLERVRRILPGPALDEAVERVERFQRQRLDELLADFDVRVRADDLERADGLLREARALADDPPRIDRATADLARAWDDRQATEEGRLKLERARELAAPPHPPRKLKQALKLYEDLLRRLDRYVGLKSAYELIKSERDEVERLIKAADRQESQWSTAIAIGHVDGLVATRDDFLEALAAGRLEEDYARSRIEDIERDIGEKLAGKIDEYLHDADEIARNPRDAAVALDRLREHERLWTFLPAPQQARVRRRAEEIEALIARRDDAMRRCDEATEAIARGEYIDAIRQLHVLRELHAALQIEVDRPLEVAISALEHRLERRLSILGATLDEAYVSDAEIEHLVGHAIAARDAIEPVAAFAPRLANLQARATEIERAARRLRGELNRCDRELERIRSLVDAGQPHRARPLVERLERTLPPQRKAELADLKEDLDLVLREDEIEGRLDLLAMTDTEAALAWAEKHPDNPACRRYRLHTHAGGLLEEVRRTEAQGEYEQALLLAGRLAEQAPPALAGHVAGLVEHLERVIRDRAEVERRLIRLREAKRQGRLAEMLPLFADPVAVPADRAAEWQSLRDEAEHGDRDRLVEDVDAALAEVRAGREAWQAVDWPSPCVLAPEGGPERPEDLGARSGLLDDALRALEGAASSAAILAERYASSAVDARLHALRVERLACRIEAHIARHEFEAAEALLGGPPTGDEDPRLARCRTRLRRLAFGRAFQQAVELGDLERARAEIERYGARASAESLLAERIAQVADAITEAIDIRDADPRAGLDRLRRAHRALLDLTGPRPRLGAALEPMRGLLIEALVGELDRLRDALERDGLPLGTVAAVQQAHALIEEDGVTDPRLDLRIESWGDELGRAARTDLEQLEGLAHLDGFSAEQLLEIERRLDVLGRVVEEDDLQLERCRRRLRVQRTARDRQRDAERRRDELVRRAIETLDADALHEACALEAEGLVSGDAAQQALESWQRAWPIVEALEAAMAARAFDRVEQLLGQLERTDSRAHIARVTLADPFEPSRALPAGVERLRALLPGLERRAAEATEQRARELAELEALVADFQVAIRKVATDAPPELEADPAFAGFVDGAARWFDEQMRAIRRRVDAAALLDDTGSGGTAERLLARLPSPERPAFTAFFVELCRTWRADHGLVMACCQAPTHVLRLRRDELSEIRARWSMVAELVRLIDDLLR